MILLVHNAHTRVNETAISRLLRGLHFWQQGGARGIPYQVWSVFMHDCLVACMEVCQTGLFLAKSFQLFPMGVLARLCRARILNDVDTLVTFMYCFIGVIGIHNWRIALVDVEVLELSISFLSFIHMPYYKFTFGKALI